VVVLIRIIKMYIRVLENRLFVIIVKYIFANKRSILLLIIVKRVMIIASWFYKNITGYKLVIVSKLRYTNEGICIAWLNYFIKHNNYSLNGE